MHALADRLEFAPPPTPGLVRALALALLAHAFLLAALTWGVQWRQQAVTVSVEAELWSAAAQQAAPKPVEATPPAPVEPVAAAEPTVQPDPAIALEREKLLRQQSAQNALAQLQERERQRLEKLKQDRLALDKKTAEEKKKTEQEAARLEAQRADNLKRMTGLAGATGAAGATGSALQSSGPSAGYAGRVSARIKPNIVFADDLTGNPKAEVEVRTAPNGSIIGRRLIKPSGVKSWDEAVLKAIDKTAELPRDVDGRVPPVLEISFRPKD